MSILVKSSFGSRETSPGPNSVATPPKLPSRPPLAVSTIGNTARSVTSPKVKFQYAAKNKGAKLELALDLITYWIAIVLVALRTSNGSVIVDDTNLATEITRVTNIVPKIVGVHSKTLAGSTHRSWLAHFSQE
ncbi:hypothetical protein EPUL_002552 [Erysiphe pulchra]|uniref:Uncharacterized protein n=1 Tax=Erysiphe pulchra TaxID=225359 RepID=A0A2S4PYZ9_9PEZI|nr:hypothetical protein EPUL_002552 [Erysiphe pulchra]